MILERDDKVAKRYHNPPPVAPVPMGAPPDAIRMDFARRLQAALVTRGWTQSDLARKVAPLLPNARLGRDNISKYIRGKVLPLPPTLAAIAKVLDMEVTDLLPSAVRRRSVETEQPPMSIRSLGEGGDMGWIQLNMALPFDTILEIRKLVRAALQENGE